MKQETANLGLVLLGALTLITLVFYTYWTWRMQKAVAAQARELNHQIKLSIMPAFTVELVDMPSPKLKLYNAGNGTAINIEIGKVSFPNIKHQIIFEKVALLLPKKDIVVGYTSYDFEGKVELNLLWKLDEKKAEDEVYDLVIDFEDIEGTKYRQIISMGKGGIKPNPVRSVVI